MCLKNPYEKSVTHTQNVTLWMTPELSCFALKGPVEAQQPNSSWQPISEKKAPRS